MKNFLCYSMMVHRIRWVLLYSQTSATRMWFGLTSIGFGSFMLFSPTVHSRLSEYNLMLQIMPDQIWGALFVLHGLALWYGLLMRTFNKLLLILEGLVGIAVWAGAGIAVSIAQGAPGAVLAGTLISFWLLVRYPTHRERTDGI